MGFALLAFPDTNPDSNDQASLLKKEITRKAKLLNKYKAIFQNSQNLRVHETVQSTLENLEREVQFQIQEYSRYPKKQYKIILRNEKIKSPWRKLGNTLDDLLFLLTGLKKNNYNSGKVWKKLDNVIVEYEDIETILDEIIQSEKGI